MLDVKKDHPLAAIANEAVQTVITLMVPPLVKPKEIENGLMPNGGGAYIILGTNSGDILAQHEHGERSGWTGPYDKVAESKFKLTVEHQLSTRDIQLLYPELAEGTGNTYYWGSCIDGGIVASCSGVDPEWDEALSKMVVAIFRAMITKKNKQELAPGKHFRS